MTSTHPTDSAPEFSVIFKGDAMEPIADVAPEGDVRFVLVNESESPHDFAVMDVDCLAATPRRYEVDDRGCMGQINGVRPGDGASAIFRLDRGRYVLVSNTPGDRLGTSLFDLTVQPVAG